MNIFYTYCYLDKTKPGYYKYKNLDIIFDYEPFYIGKGKNNRIFINTHLTKALDKTFLDKKIKKIGKENIISIKLFNNLKEIDAYAYEMKLIKDIGRRNKGLGPLVNLTEGGGGISGYKHTKESRIKIGNSSLGRKHSDAAKEKIRLANIGPNNPNFGKPLSIKHKKKLSIALKGRKHSLEHMKNAHESRRKKVAQINLSTKEILKIYDCVREARSITKIAKIDCVCRGERNHAGGYFWKYL